MSECKKAGVEIEPKMTNKKQEEKKKVRRFNVMKIAQRHTTLFFIVLLICSIAPICAFAVETTGWVWPVPASKHMSQGFKDGHSGIDIISERGENETIVAARAGKVVVVFEGCNLWAGINGDHYSNCNPVAHLIGEDRWGIRDKQFNGNDVCNAGFGRGVVIDHGNGVFSMYCHMASTSVYAGQDVEAGTVIGTMGAYGYADGRHLHFEIKENCYLSGYWPKGDSVNTNPYGSEYLINDYDWNNYVDNIWYSEAAPTEYYVDMTGAKQTYIMLADNSNSVLAVNPVNNNVQIETKADTATQLWCFEKQNDDSYIITSLYNGYALEVAGGGNADETNVQVYPRSSGENNAQRWYVILGNGGNYYKPKCAPSKRMDAYGGNSTPGTNIQIFTSNGTAAQRYSAYYQNDLILPTGLSLGGTTDVELKPGQTTELLVEFTPWNTSKKGLNWKSSNISVATVSSSGVITAVGEGTATITATSTFNTTISASRRIVVASPVEKPQITELSVNGRMVNLSWTASPLVDDNDVSAYEVVLWNTNNWDTITYSDITDTNYEFTVASHGNYSVQVTAINTTDGTRSKADSRSFIALDEEWMDLSWLPNDLPEDCEVQYVNHYNNKEQPDSPGEGWTRGAGHTTYTNGDVIYSHDRMTTSDTLVEIGTYYFHFCDGSGEVERFRTDRFCNETNLDNNGQFNVVGEYADSDPNYKVYRLQWNSGEWAGGLATCPYGSSDALALYYIGYRYQRRTAVTTYTWTKEDTVSSERDPNADSVTYRVREMVTYDNCLVIPAGTTRIEAEAFMNDTMIQEVVIPEDCEYIGNKAFSGCTGLRRVYVPAGTQIESDAFEGCTQYEIIRTGE